jgi:molybdopterin synthase sulfur carrier subunit
VKVNFYATLRQIVGQKTVEFPVQTGSTIKELVTNIVARYPKLRPELLDESGHIHGYIHLFINGRDAPYLDDALETVIQPDDKIDIFPAVGGG